MRHEFIALSIASFALVASACNRPLTDTSANGEESQLASSESSANQEMLDVSDASGAGAEFFAQSASSGSASVAGCQVQKQVISTGTACSTGYAKQVQLTWSCTGPNGGTSQGTATIDTTVTPDACPPSSIAIAQTIGYDRVRAKGDLSGELSGSANVSWNIVPSQATATKQVAIDLEHKVTNAGNLVRHQTLSGDKTVVLSGNGPGLADDTRVANGSLDVNFLLAGDELNATEDNLTFMRDCPFPVAGTISWTKSGNVDGSGSITFGPACGQAVNANGDSIDLSSND